MNKQKTKQTNPTEILTQKHKPKEAHKYSFDEVYGMDLNEYLNLHCKSINTLISETQIDIAILENNYKKLYDKIHNQGLSSDQEYEINLAKEINDKILKKKSHLERLEEFHKGMETFTVANNGEIILKKENK